MIDETKIPPTKEEKVPVEEVKPQAPPQPESRDTVPAKEKPREGGNPGSGFSGH